MAYDAPMPDDLTDEGRRAEELARGLDALSNPLRVRLLGLLRTPKHLREIRLRRAVLDRADGQLLARQSVKDHLQRLVDGRIVSVRRPAGGGGFASEYVVNHQTVFTLAEELRELARVRPVPEPGAATLHATPSSTPRTRKHPALVLVKGLDEGRTFELVPPPSGTPGWIIGRARRCHVALDFDPYASTENARVGWANRAHFVEDLPESANGTTLNFELLPKATAKPLHAGDIIGVGRSLLVYQP